MDYQMGGTIVFLILLAITVFGYFQSSKNADRQDRRRRSAEVLTGGTDLYERR